MSVSLDMHPQLLIGVMAALSAAFANGNECANFLPYSQSLRRHWEYKLEVGEPSVLDYYMDNNLGEWYGTFGVDLWGKAPGRGSCGSKYPVWIRESERFELPNCTTTPKECLFIDQQISDLVCCSSLSPHKTDVQVITNASTVDWGGTCNVLEPQGLWDALNVSPAFKYISLTDGRGEAEMCLQTIEKDCFISWNINATDCGTVMVYKLMKTPVPDSAYCTGMAEDSPSAPPSVTITPVAVMGYTKNRQVIIYCDFNSITHPLLFYETLWYVNGKFVHRTPIQKWSNNYKILTALSQTTLEKKGIHRLGFDTHCQVVTRSSITGSPDSNINSQRKFFGIKVENSTITITNEQVAELYLEATAPIVCPPGSAGECALYVDIHLGSYSSGSNSPEANNPKAYIQSNCGVKIPASTDGSISRSLPFRIRGEVKTSHEHRQGTSKFRLKTAEYHDMQFWRNVDVSEITVIVKTNPTAADGKHCAAHNDPHMVTFDGRNYEHHFTGIYTLYKHTTLPIEVQVGFKRCGSTASCGYAVAVRVGRTVYRIILNERWQFYYASCESDTIKIKRDGHQYMMYLPTGTYIYVRTLTNTSNDRSDIWIYPTSEDVHHTSGLCGTLNGNCSDDFTLRDGSRDRSPTASRPCNSHDRSDSFRDFSASWSVSSDENLFSDNNLQKLTPWHSKGYKYCTCKTNGGPGPVPGHENELTCSADRHKSAKNKQWWGYTVNPPTNCFIMNRRRRSLGADSEHVIRRREAQMKEPLKAWDEKRARKYCNSVFNTSAALKACANVKQTDVEGNLENCIFDVQQLQSPEIAMSAVEASKTTCLQEAMMDVDLQNETQPGSGTIFEQVRAVICPFDCSGHGVCKNGTCICERHFGAGDCSIKLNDPPMTFGLGNDGYCDVMNETCEETSVFTQYVVDSSDVKCKLRPFSVDLDNVESPHDTVTVEPRIESFSEAVCTLPPERQVRSTSDPPSDATWKGYRVSIANDGVTFSREDILILFNSECQRCEISGDSVKCEFVIPACILNDVCVKPGEFHPTIPCYKCDEDQAGVWTRTKDEGCLIEEPASVVWITQAVVGVVVAIVLVVGLVWVSSRKRKQKTLFPIAQSRWSWLWGHDDTGKLTTSEA